MTHAQVFCKDCRYFQATRPTLMGDVVGCNWCLKNPVFDLVLGNPTYRYAGSERAIINEPDHCGQEGKWFEAKEIEDADLDDLSTIPFGR